MIQKRQGGVGRAITFLFLVFSIAHRGEAAASSIPQSTLYARVIDVGAGLSVIIKVPGSSGKTHYILYDAGNRKYALDDIKEVIGPSGTIDLMVISHTDADHLGAVPEVCSNYSVKKIYWPGMDRDTITWAAADQAIRAEASTGGATLVDLSTKAIQEGESFNVGKAEVTLVCGFAEPPSDWDISGESEAMNAGSIVIKIKYEGKSILLCGDAVGRHIGAPSDSIIATELHMVENADDVSIKADVLIAPHHGADNGSSKAFIREVKPSYVVFSAGHKFSHPRKTAATRYREEGIPAKNMFRTDRGDDEGALEWSYRRSRGSSDPVGDDDVEIFIRTGGGLNVKYVSTN